MGLLESLIEGENFRQGFLNQEPVNSVGMTQPGMEELDWLQEDAMNPFAQSGFQNTGFGMGGGFFQQLMPMAWWFSHLQNQKEKKGKGPMAQAAITMPSGISSGPQSFLASISPSVQSTVSLPSVAPTVSSRTSTRRRPSMFWGSRR